MTTLRQRLVTLALNTGDTEYAAYLATASMSHSTMLARMAYYNSI